MELPWHVVYLSFEDRKVGRNYIGKHSTFDLHDGYLGSFTDQSFSPDHKIILEYCRTEEGAVKAEIRWQKVFQVVEDTLFANRSYQTSDKFLYRSFGEDHHAFGKSMWHTSEGVHCFSEECPGPEWTKGKHPSVGEKLSQSIRGENNPNYGNRWTWTWTEAQTSAVLNRPKGKEHHWSSDNRDISGSLNPFYGKTHTDDAKEKNRLAHTGENNSVTGTKWWVNENGELRREKESPGNEWQNGKKWRNKQ
jgi:hypothetical protein